MISYQCYQNPMQKLIKLLSRSLYKSNILRLMLKGLCNSLWCLRSCGRRRWFSFWLGSFRLMRKVLVRLGKIPIVSISISILTSYLEVSELSLIDICMFMFNLILKMLNYIQILFNKSKAYKKTSHSRSISMPISCKVGKICNFNISSNFAS